MIRCVLGILVLTGTLLLETPARGASEIVIAIRYLQAEGISHSHLYLYREDGKIDGPGHGKHYLLRDLKTGVETGFSKLPGFEGVFGLLHDNQDNNRHFLFDGLLRLAFFDLHLNSSDGDTVFALDLTGPRL